MWIQTAGNRWERQAVKDQRHLHRGQLHRELHMRQQEVCASNRQTSGEVNLIDYVFVA